jgi:Ca2+-transporting ATPase
MNPFSNYMLLVAVFTSVMMVLTMIYVPFLNETLGTHPLNLNDWMIVAVASLIPVAAVEFYKALQRRKL